MNKAAAEEGMREGFSPFPHQERFIKKLVQERGIVAAHGTGTGKTFSSIAGFDRLHKSGKAKSALVVVPAGLKANYAEAIDQFSTYGHQTVGPKGQKNSVYLDKIDGGKKFTIVSYSMFRRAPKFFMDSTGADTLIFDEFHKARNQRGKIYKAAASIRGRVNNFMGLTASPTNNDPVEMVPLINLAAGREVMSVREFNSKHRVRVARQRGFFGGDKYVESIVDVAAIKKRLGPKIDYVTSDDIGKDMPPRTVETVKVPMSPDQKKVYEWTMKKVGPVAAYKIRNNLPVTQKEASHIFTMISQARQATNTLHPFKKGWTSERGASESPKVTKLLDDTMEHLGETPDGKVVLYSNLIKGGVDVLSAGLKARGVDHAVFVGKGRQIGDKKITEDVRNAGVADFKAGKKNVIILSSAGAEGLDFKNATMFQSLDSHFNPERIRQAEARARRLKGQRHRPEEKRMVKVKRYLATYPKRGLLGRAFGKKQQTTDEWIHGVALRKHRLNEKLRGAFKQERLLPKPKPKSAPKPAPPAPKPLAPPPAVVNPAGLPTQGAGAPIVPLRPPEALKVKHPPKYKRKWQDIRGQWRYEY